MKNDDFFIQILDKFNGNYHKIPKEVYITPLYQNNLINSTIVYTNSGSFYINNPENITKITDIIRKSPVNLHSIYIEEKFLNLILANLLSKPRNIIKYHFMKTDKNSFKPDKSVKYPYKRVKCNDKNFESLKNLHYNYHLEEVYNDGSYYPYDYEMTAYKKLLSNRINFAVFDEEGIAVSKANVNAEAQNSYQIGGVYTLKDFRNQGLSKICVSSLVNELLKKKDSVYLYVKKDNIPAISVYKSLGFTTVYNAALIYF